MSQTNQTPGGEGKTQAAQPEPKPAVIQLRPSSDGMKLDLSLQKMGENTIPPTVDDVMALLKEKGVVYGIDEGMIGILCAKPVYFRAFTVAKGKPGQVGKDGYLHYLVETARDLRPKMLEDGTVDFRDLGFIQLVREGDALCEIHPPEKGADGCNVFGVPVEGRYGKAPLDPAGKNTVRSEDGTLLLAACSGTAEVKRGIVEIHNVLQVPGHVDNSTGNIKFIGDIIISGDVVSGFSVETANGSVTVKGSVEGATIIADGDIFVGHGINGMNRGSIEAGGSIKCKYIQSSYIKAGGNIYADSIMYCRLECGGNVELSGKRAALIGGRNAIAGKLIAKTVGTESHVPTQVVMVSSGVEKENELAVLDQKMKAIDEETKKLLQIMARYEDLLGQGRLNSKQKGIILTVRENYTHLLEERQKLVEQHQQVKQEQLAASQVLSSIECKDRVHTGVQITFGPLIMNVKTSFVNSRIFVKDQEIQVGPL